MGRVSTAIEGGGGRQAQPELQRQVDGTAQGMGAAMQMAQAIEPLDHQRQQSEQPNDQQAGGLVMAEVLEAVAVLGPSADGLKP